MSADPLDTWIGLEDGAPRKGLPELSRPDTFLTQTNGRVRSRPVTPGQIDLMGDVPKYPNGLVSDLLLIAFTPRRPLVQVQLRPPTIIAVS